MYNDNLVICTSIGVVAILSYFFFQFQWRVLWVHGSNTSQLFITSREVRRSSNNDAIRIQTERTKTQLVRRWHFHVCTAGIFSGWRKKNSWNSQIIRSETCGRPDNVCAHTLVELICERVMTILKSPSHIHTSALNLVYVCTRKYLPTITRKTDFVQNNSI